VSECSKCGGQFEFLRVKSCNLRPIDPLCLECWFGCKIVEYPPWEGSKSLTKIVMDESGQWWYVQKSQRTRLGLAPCKTCGKMFPVTYGPANRRSFCCIQCSDAWLNSTSRAGGHKAGNWRGGKSRRKNGGYVRAHAPDHPASSSRGTILEHRLVMEAQIGRFLEPHETVHHKNGIRYDNRPENLELWSGNHPPGARVIDQISWAREVLKTYGHLYPEEATA
jgi:hypothetical protein